MILLRLSMLNFRQFRGQHNLVLTDPSAENGRNVTVVYGDNGLGKTGIFRAMMFCLYGDRKLSQDEDTARDELHLVNLHALRESEGGDTFPVEAFVEAEFSHEGKRYVLRRTLSALREGQHVHEDLVEVSLTIQTSSGNTTAVTDPNEAARHVSRILDPRVREYFLFDGERIERLTRASAEQRREVSQGIRNLLNIDDLQLSIRAARGLCRKLDKEVQEKSTPELAKTIKQINDLEDEQSSVESQLSQLDDELRVAWAESQKVDKELDNFKEIQSLLDSRYKLEQRLDEVREEGSVGLGKMRERTAKAAVSLIEPAGQCHS